MAACRLTLLRVLPTPSAKISAWRHCIEVACKRAGWSYYDYWGGEPPVIDGGNAVIMGATSEALPYDFDHHVVLSCSPDDVVDFLQAGPPERSLDDARYHAAAYLAVAANQLDRGAIQVHQTQTWCELPGLGRVDGPADAGPIPAQGLADDLSLYADVPLKPGVTQQWSPDILTYHGADLVVGEEARISLIGRRRLLLNGPNIALPPGEWTVRTRLTILEDCRPELLIEWGYQTSVASLTHRFEEPGTYEIELTFVWSEVAPADFRISLMTSMLHGEMSLAPLEIRKGSDTPFAETADHALT